MNLKHLKSVSGQTRIGDAQSTQMVFIDGETIGKNKNEVTTMELDSFIEKNRGKLWGIASFMERITDIAQQYGCEIQFEVNTNPQLVSCLIYKDDGTFAKTIGLLKFAVIRPATRQLVEKLNMGQEI